jgi:hypothetical protein
MSIGKINRALDGLDARAEHALDIACVTALRLYALLAWLGGLLPSGG